MCFEARLLPEGPRPHRLEQLGLGHQSSLRARPGNAARHKPWGQQKALVVSVVPATPQTLVDDVKPEGMEPDHDRSWGLCTQDTPNRMETPFQPKHDRELTTSTLRSPNLTSGKRSDKENETDHPC